MSPGPARGHRRGPRVFALSQPTDNKPAHRPGPEPFPSLAWSHTTVELRARRRRMCWCDPRQPPSWRSCPRTSCPAAGFASHGPNLHYRRTRPCKASFQGLHLPSGNSKGPHLTSHEAGGQNELTSPAPAKLTPPSGQTHPGVISSPQTHTTRGITCGSSQGPTLEPGFHITDSCPNLPDHEDNKELRSTGNVLVVGFI